MPPRQGPQFIDLTTESGRKKHLSGHARQLHNEIHVALEQRALDALVNGDPIADIAAAEHQRTWGAPPPQSKPEPPPRLLTPRQQRRIRMLLDPNIAPTVSLRSTGDLAGGSSERRRRDICGHGRNHSPSHGRALPQGRCQ
jgi:hypothetical protein